MKTDLKNDYDLPKQLKLKTAVDDVEQRDTSRIAGRNGKVCAAPSENSKFS